MCPGAGDVIHHGPFAGQQGWGADVTGGLSSRERMLAALSCEHPDHIPCSFMLFRALHERIPDPREALACELELGLDARVCLPRLPVRVDPAVRIREWKEPPAGSPEPLLHKAYETPAGTLCAIARQTPDWPWGDHVPLLDDYLAPRSVKFLVTGPDDLAPLRYLFAPPADDDIRQFQAEAHDLKELAREHDLLVSAGGVGGPENPDMMGLDALMWLCDMQQAILWGLEQPELLDDLRDIVAQWNRRRMEIVLDVGVDLIVKRAWYEGTDFWSPDLYRRLMVPVLKAESRLAHQAGARFGYIITSGVMPLVDDMVDAGIDVMIGVDPVQGKGTDMRALKARLAGKMCVWGGVNGFLTVEQQGEDEIRRAVCKAVDVLGPDGFILSPVDNVRDPSDRVWRNTLTLIDAWKQHRAR